MKYDNQIWGYSWPAEGMPSRGAAFGTNSAGGGQSSLIEALRAYTVTPTFDVLASADSPTGATYLTTGATQGLVVDHQSNCSSKHRFVIAVRIKVTVASSVRFWFGMSDNSGNGIRAFERTGQSNFVGWCFDSVKASPDTNLFIHSGAGGAPATNYSEDSGIPFEGFDDRLAIIWHREEYVQFIRGEKTIVGEFDLASNPDWLPRGYDDGYPDWNNFLTFYSGAAGQQWTFHGMIWRNDLV